MTLDVNTRLVSMPVSIRGYTVKNPDSSYTIILNACISDDAIAAAYMHEIKHILDDDFEKADVQQIETAAHQTR